MDGGLSIVKESSISKKFDSLFLSIFAPVVIISVKKKKKKRDDKKCVDAGHGLKRKRGAQLDNRGDGAPALRVNSYCARLDKRNLCDDERESKQVGAQLD